MISHTHKCIFVHIPRTAGSSVEAILWPDLRKESDLWMGFVSKYRNKYQTGGLQHLQASQIIREVGEDIFSHYFKFSIVRNPWDKAVSQFTYMKQRDDFLPAQKAPIFDFIQLRSMITLSLLMNHH